MNSLLANLVVEYHKLQNFHWFVKGSDFFTAHAKLEEFYDGINEAIDEVAEKLLMAGGKPLANLKEFLEVSTIKEACDSYRSSAEVFTSVLSDFELLKKECEEVKELADEEKVYFISAYMDELIDNFAKTIWMIKQRQM